jgi:hypothetical protein
MDKSIITKILKSQQITQIELNTFITEYIKLVKDEDITTQQLQMISTLVQSGHFNLFYAAKIAALKLDLNFDVLTDRSGDILNVIVRES